MKLEKFRITNYRSIRDSGWVDIGQRTVMVGRNESGKSNLLLALRLLKPSEKLEPLTLAKDFPADLPRASFRDDMDVVRTLWALNQDERRELGALFSRASSATHVEVGRGYHSDCWVRFNALSNDAGGGGEIVLAGKPETPEPAEVEVPDNTLETETPDVAAAGATSAGAEDLLARLGARYDMGVERQAPADLDGADPEKAAREWVLERMPTFSYLDEYPDIDGHQNLCEFQKRQTDGTPSPGDEYFEKLLIAADLDPKGIDRLLTADTDTRRQAVNHAGSVVTRKLRELWSDRALKVRFDLDGETFNTLISDPSSVYDVEINLSSRSRGFRWFFSFYVAFAADAKSGKTGNTLLLLDEPGTHLHPLGQRDLLNHLASDFDSQVLLTTQSPFMVPGDDLAGVRTVSISEEEGTTVSNKPTGDQRTVFPVAHALSAEIASGLLGGELSLVVEEVSDFWYLRCISNYVRERGGTGLPLELAIRPAGGSTGVFYMNSLLTSQDQQPAVVLMGSRPNADAASDALNSGLLPGSNVVFLSDLFDDANTSHIEDLIEARVYDQLVRTAYKSQLGDVELEVDANIPGTLVRFEQALTAAGAVFSRDKIARVFMRAMSQSADAVVPEASREKFEKLFCALWAKFEGVKR